MQHIHLIGIGGAGLSAIATVLLQQGYTVSGSDLQAGPATDRLRQLGAEIFIGQRAENLQPGIDVVVMSSAIGPENPEVVAARQQGLRVVKRAEWLGQMMADYTGIAVAGTHGKTTTTAMIAFLLREAGLDPTYIVGGFVPQIDTNAAAGSGPAFVIEADEYDHMFLGLRPQVAIVTNIEWDHPDIFPTVQDMQQAFVNFVQRVPADGLVIGCAVAPGVAEALAAAQAKTVTYGLEAGSAWRALNVQPNQRGGFDFEATPPGDQPVPVSLAVPGQHNVLNALAALIVAEHQGVALAQSAEILSRFTGVDRRFQLKGEVGGITVVDDYAHHPTEIRATLAAARARFPQRPIWTVFQPHTFSRTHTLLADFAAAFDDADHVIVVDIFPSREQDTGLVHSRDLLARMRHPNAHYIGPLSAAVDDLSARLSAPAVVITLGAGDGYKVGEWLLERIANGEVTFLT